MAASINDIVAPFLSAPAALVVDALHDQPTDGSLSISDHRALAEPKSLATMATYRPPASNVLPPLRRTIPAVYASPVDAPLLA
jgi:hypothetical protein